MHFGATLRLLRVDAGLSLRELARRLGVSSAYLSRVENGRDAAPTPDRLAGIADALGLPRAVMVELARQTGPVVSGYLARRPEASALFLDIARRALSGAQIARVKRFIDAEFPQHDPRPRGPALSDLLPPSHVVLGVACDDLADLVAIGAASLGGDLDLRDVVKRVLAREGEASSAVGHGLVVPHATWSGAPEALILLTLARPLALPAPDKRPISVALMALHPGGHGALELLTRVVRLASYDIADELCRAQSEEQAIGIIADLEALW